MKKNIKALTIATIVVLVCGALIFVEIARTDEGCSFDWGKRYVKSTCHGKTVERRAAVVSLNSMAIRMLAVQLVPAAQRPDV